MAIKEKTFGSYREKQTKLIAVEQLLGKALKAYKIDQAVSRYKFVMYWEEIVGKELAKVSRPDSIVNKKLIITVKGSVWSQQLSFYSKVILTRVRKYLDSADQVDGLRFRVE